MTAVVRMWEATVRPGRLDDAVAWLTGTAGPAALAAGASAAEAFRAVGADRAVLITRWPAAPAWTEPAPPEPLWTRAHAWEFEPVT